MINNFKIVDLTHLITNSVPTWQGSASFSFTIIKDYHQGIRTQQFTISSNTGTHIDAPGHLDKSAKMIDAIPLSQLVVPACMLDVSAKAHADYRVPIQEVETFEKQYGTIPANCLFIIHTGWCKYWSEHQKYRNIDQAGKMHFPGLSREVTQLLIERKVAGIAIDTFSPDSGDEHFSIHKLLLSKGIYIIENITNANQLPPVGGFVAALPIKIFDAVEAPSRIIGFIPK